MATSEKYIYLHENQIWKHFKSWEHSNFFPDCRQNINSLLTQNLSPFALNKLDRSAWSMFEIVKYCQNLSFYY